MGSLMEGFKRQASFFLREKIKTARLALTDVTPAQILTEEVTNGDPLAPNVQAMRLICRAAFEVDDYGRIVNILHHRLSKFDTRYWRESYKVLILLEHLLTQGPQRIAEEFENDRQTITDMSSFHYLDQTGFNWGLSMKNKCERIIKLLEDRSYRVEERAKARKLRVGIQGFGSISQQQLAIQENSRAEATFDKIIQKSSSDNNLDHAAKYNLLEDMAEILKSNTMPKIGPQCRSRNYAQHAIESDHPFWGNEEQTRTSLLSYV